MSGGGGVEGAMVPEGRAEGPATDLFGVLDRLPDLVLVHRQGRILFVNRACVDNLGYSAVEDFVGKDMNGFIHPDDRAETARRVARMMQSRRTLPSRDMRIFHRDGSVLWVELAPVQFIELPDGTASLVLARDRTQQRKIQDRLMVTDRLASLGSLASGVAHEVSNPLTFIMGNLAVISEGLQDLETRGVVPPGELTELQRAIADARVGSERVRDLIADLKVFSRPDLGERAELDLRRVMDSAINMAWPEIRQRSRLIRDYGPTPPVRGVESKLALAFFHLLTNAAQAIPPGDISAHAVEVGLGERDDGWAWIEVRDDGGGLSEAIRDRMWEPFFSTHARGEGAGLGLPVVRSVIVTMGGEIEVEDRPEGGTLFRILLPPGEGMTERRGPTPLPEISDGEVRYGRVLVIDDEPVIGALVRRALVGHDVYLMTSGRDALELIQELEFDVILCDLVMPDVGGIDVYETVRAKRPEMLDRLVFVTAGAFSSAERRFLDGVRNQVLDKPFDFLELRSVVQGILRRIRS